MSERRLACRKISTERTPDGRRGDDPLCKTVLPPAIRRCRSVDHHDPCNGPHKGHREDSQAASQERGVSRKMILPRDRSVGVLFGLCVVLCCLTPSQDCQTTISSSNNVPISENQQHRTGAAASSTTQAPPQSPSVLKRDLSGALRRAGGAATLLQHPSMMISAAMQGQNHSRDPATQQKHSPVCQVSNGESVAIVEIDESLGTDFGQSTKPNELPISGSVESGEIELKIESETHKYFKIVDKRLQLVRALDRDAVLKENSTQIVQQPISSIYLQISCVDKRPNNSNSNVRQVIIPVLVKVLDLNDNAPKFPQPVYSVQVDELAPKGTVVLDTAQAIDLDSANNGLIEYTLVQGDSPPSSAAPYLSPSASTPPAATSSPQVASSYRKLIPREKDFARGESTPPSPPSSFPSSPSSSSSTQMTTRLPSPVTTTAAAETTVTTSGTAAASANTETPKSIPVTTVRVAGEDNQAGGSSAVPTTASRKPSNEPTINLNSEPILNGPMDDDESEEESDEELLAALNGDHGEQQPALNGNSTGAPASGSEQVAREDDSADLNFSRRRGLMLIRGAGTARAPATDSYGSQPQAKRRRRRDSMSGSTAATLAATTTVADIAAAVARRKQQQHSPGPTTTNPFWSSSAASAAAAAAAATSSVSVDAGSFITNSGGPAKNNNNNEHSAANNNNGQDSEGAGEYFALEIAPLSHKPIIKLKRQLDYETRRTHTLTLVARDRAANEHDRLIGRAKIIVRVTDGDDQPPVFVLNQFGCATKSLPVQQPTATSPSIALRSLPSSPSYTTRASSDNRAPSGSLVERMAEDEDLMAPGGDHLDPAAELGGAPNSRPKGPKGFKVRDENFDFSDSLLVGHTASVNPLQQVSLAISGATLEPIMSAPAAPARGAPSAPFTEPANQLSASTSLPGADYSCLGSSDLNNGQTEYFATVMSGESDYLLRVAPQSIRARDLDELNAPIRYTFMNGTPSNYSLYFQLNPVDATVRQVAPVERSLIGHSFKIWLRAQEQTPKRLASMAKLTIDVIANNKSPPVIVPNSYVGFITENAPLGARVSVGGNNVESLRISVVDANVAGGPSSALSYDFETTSDAFKVDKNGYVYVANRKPLDRDEPTLATQMFQVTARQLNVHTQSATSQISTSTSSQAAQLLVSSPVSINVTLLDENDNGPKFSNTSVGPIYLPADSRGGIHKLTRMSYTDRDTAENSRARFVMRHVSNNGRDRFRLDEDTGQLDAVGRFSAGEQFSLSVELVDELQRSAQAIVEVVVVPGANTGGPQFVIGANPAAAGAQSSAVSMSDVGTQSASFNNGADSSAAAAASASTSLAASTTTIGDNWRGYFVEVSEAVQPQSTILQVHAIDPENDPISYSIVDGNSHGDFGINSKTGALYLVNKLDREEVSSYSLLVQARDSGGLATMRPVRVSVLDSNDENPTFDQPAYKFAVEEGPLSVGKKLGRVSASDSDAGENGRITYSIRWLTLTTANTEGPASLDKDKHGGIDRDDQTGLLKNVKPLNGDDDGSDSDPNVTFAIDEHTGDIYLKGALDYECATGHTLIVTARDNGENPRSNSTTVSIQVIDIQDELPYFEGHHSSFIGLSWDENSLGGRKSVSLAQVRAHDPDSAPQITYSMLAGDANLFEVHPTTGQVSLIRALDYEQAKQHTIIIGLLENPPKNLIDASNKLSAELAGTRQSGSEHHADRSSDTVDGAGSSRFNKRDGFMIRSQICRIDVHVNDINDEGPQFDMAPQLPIRIQDSIGVGAEVARVSAHDNDGSMPNNQIRYELVTAGKQTNKDNIDDSVEVSPSNKADTFAVTDDLCSKLFLVDPTSGSISVRSDLKHATSVSECGLVIRAYDTPIDKRLTLSSATSLTIFIDHLAELSSAAQVCFADTHYTVEVYENIAPRTLIKVLPVINKPVEQVLDKQQLQQQQSSMHKSSSLFPMNCELVSGNELNNFYVMANDQRDCELRVNLSPGNHLDSEQRSRYSLNIRLNTIGSANSMRTIAQVNVNILDRNDNKPIFQVPTRYAQLTQNRYLASVPVDAPSDTSVVQVRALDIDTASNSNGLVAYELLNESDLEHRFRIDPSTGMVYTNRPIEDMPSTRLPARLKVSARDQPEIASESLESITDIMVNLIDDRHRIVLVLKEIPARRVLDVREQLLGALQERTGLIAAIERVESLKLQRHNHSNLVIESDTSGSDVWFHLIEPGTLRIMPSDEIRSKTSLFETRAQNSLADIIGQMLGLSSRVPIKIRLPYPLSTAGSQSGSLGSTSSVLQAMHNSIFGSWRPIQALQQQQSSGSLQTEARSNGQQQQQEQTDRIAPSIIMIAIVITIISAIALVYQCGVSAAASSAAGRSTTPMHFGILPGGPNSMHTAGSISLGAKEKLFLNGGMPPPTFAPLPPPPGSFRASSTTTRQNGSSMGMSIPSARQMIPCGQPGDGGCAGSVKGDRESKEYETQMLKMSVLFDDNGSLNLDSATQLNHTHRINPNVMN